MWVGRVSQLVGQLFGQLFGSRVSLTLTWVGLAVLTASCDLATPLPDPGTAPTGPNVCTRPFARKLVPLRITNAKNLYFSMPELEFMNDPHLRVAETVLQIKVPGVRKPSDGEIRVAANGVQASAKGGAQPIEYFPASPGQEFTFIRIKLDRMKLNGALTFLSVFNQIFRNSGNLKLSVSGKNATVLSATLEFSGTYYETCPKPTPTPTPTPIPTEPETNLISVTPIATPTASPVIRFEFSSDQSDVTFQCALDGAAPALCASPSSFSGLASGEHIFWVFARNSAGLVDATPASYVWEVDTIAPEVGLDPFDVLTNSPSVELGFHASDAQSYLCSMDGSPTVACSSPIRYGSLNEGDHLFSVIGIDAVGNRSASPALAPFRVDLTPPVISIVSVSPSDSPSNWVDGQILFTASEPSTFECAFDGVAFVPCQSPANYAGLSEGVHSFTTRAVDLAGNPSSEISYSFEIDLTAPMVTLGAVFPAPGLTNARRITAEFWADEIGHFECSLDEGTFAACTSPFAADFTLDGLHSLGVRAIDQAGNISEVHALEWRLDFQAAELSFASIEPAGAMIKSAQLQATVFASDATAIISARIDGMSVAVTNGLITLSGITEGAHRLEVSATDAAGNVSLPILHDFVVDLTAPKLSLMAVTSGTTTSTSNQFEFSSDEDVTFECNFNEMGYAPCSSPYVVSGLAEGMHELLVRARDLAGNLSDVVSHSWIVDLTPPELGVVGRQEGTDLVFILTSNEPGTAFECALDGAEIAACQQTMRYSGLSSGTHQFFARGTDPSGNLDPAGVFATATVDTIIPLPSNITSSVTRTSITMYWTTNEPATSQAYYAVGVNAIPSRATSETTVHVTTHQVTLNGLIPNRPYSVQVSGRDPTGNRYFSTKVVVTTAP